MRALGAVLSAMVDGEATAGDLVDVRPHLRNWPACRATVRELRRSSMPLAAVFPAAGLVLGDGPVEQAGGLLGRVAEWVLTSAHERAVGSVMRAQAVLDTPRASDVRVAAPTQPHAGGSAADRVHRRDGLNGRVGSVPAGDPQRAEPQRRGHRVRPRIPLSLARRASTRTVGV